ncbi:hypothetical protein SCLCIDRAFT_1207900 [Scleroderma citrinum Foug A]|uniref:Uncharacterized protein n=1 Tax=Scleroderma citrinum Foug A TaxID=1036808 RepID=A0A0C3E9N9_9AGAM|nr:hypothetical protein SCLCIDRAFT_1207900 [Scleroderma citrinum Foug A]
MLLSMTEQSTKQCVESLLHAWPRDAKDKQHSEVQTQQFNGRPVNTSSWTDYWLPSTSIHNAQPVRPIVLACYSCRSGPFCIEANWNEVLNLG